jgi:hypothetical protein
MQQVCDLLGCKERKVFYLLADGTLEKAPQYGKAIRVYTDSVLKALERPKRKGRKPRAPLAHHGQRINLSNIPL